MRWEHDQRESDQRKRHARGEVDEKIWSSWKVSELKPYAKRKIIEWQGIK